MNTSTLQTEHQLPPRRSPGAGYFWYRNGAGEIPELFTLSGRPVKDLKRQGATYDEIARACCDGYRGIAEVNIDGRIVYYPNLTTGGEQATSQASERVAAPAAADSLQPSRASMADIWEVLPEQMAQARRWLLYKLIPNTDSAKKPRKVPFYASGAARQGILDSLDDINELVSLDEAIAALSTGDYAGLGFALGADGTGNYWQGVDFDDVSLHPELEYLVDSAPSYTEISPGGDGMHAIGYGKPFPPLGSNGTGIEAYSGGRFFTVTASGAGRNPICDLSYYVETQLRPVHRRGQRRLAEGMDYPTEHFSQVDPQTVTELRSALLAMRSDDRSLWVKMAHALKSLGEVGRGLWLDWSAISEKFDPADAGRVWDSVREAQIDYRVVFAEAQRHGWINPRSSNAHSRPASGEAALQRKEINNIPTSADDLDRFVVALEWGDDIANEHPHYVERIVPEGEVTLLAGHGGAGKSYVALLMSVLVALGRSFGPLTTRRAKVLFYSAEDDHRELLRRVARICRLLSIDMNDLNGWLYLLDVSEIDATLYDAGHSDESFPRALLHTLSDFVERHDIGIVIIDNASDVFGGNENFRKQVRGFIRSLRTEIARPSRAVILLAHISKVAAHSKAARMSGDEDYSGSTAWHNSVRSRLTLERDSEISCTLKHKKSNKAPLADDLGFTWSDGVPVLNGVLPISEGAAESLIKGINDKSNQEDKAMLLSIVKDFEDRGENLTTSMQGSVTIYKSIVSHPKFKRGMTKERVNELVRQLEHERKLIRYKYRNDNRKSVTSFRVAPNALVEPRPLKQNLGLDLLDLIKKSGKCAFKFSLTECAALPPYP